MPSKNPILMLCLAGLALAGAVPAQDLARFSATADALSKGIHLKVFQAQWKPASLTDNHWEQYEDYEYESNGCHYTLRFQAHGFRDLETAALTAGGETFQAFSQEVLLGRTSLFKRTYQRQTASARERTGKAQQAYHACLESNPQPAELERHRKAIWALAGQQVEVKTFLEGAAELRSTDQPYLDLPFASQTLAIQGRVFSGTHPKLPGILFQNQDRGIEGSWPVEARAGLRTLQDLQAAGLIDSTDLKCARVSQWQFIYDGWWPGHAPKQAVPCRLGLPLAGDPGGTASVVVGQEKLGPSFVPAEAGLAPTFMLPAADRTPMNCQTDFARPAQRLGLAVPAAFAPSLLPIAGLDQEDRIFVMSWISVAGENGLFVLCQYQDEEEPRLAFLDSSGLVFRLFKGQVAMGIKGVKTLGPQGESLYDEALWGPNRGRLAGDAANKDLGTVQLPHFEVLAMAGPYVHEPGQVRKSGAPWRESTVERVMPRALW